MERGTLGEVWAAMEAMVDAGAAARLGVCNFNEVALRVLLALPPRVLPCVNQVERHPLLPQWRLLHACAARGVRVQAHSPLGHANEKLIRQPVRRATRDAPGARLELI
eukprot:3978998-Pleurochrysis_carterae.AAC.1